jgi:hypothetical protein
MALWKLVGEYAREEMAGRPFKWSSSEVLLLGLACAWFEVRR